MPRGVWWCENEALETGRGSSSLRCATDADADARDVEGGATKIGERVNCNSAIGPAKEENRRFHIRAGIIIWGQWISVLEE